VLNTVAIVRPKRQALNTAVASNNTHQIPCSSLLLLAYATYII